MASCRRCQGPLGPGDRFCPGCGDEAVGAGAPIPRRREARAPWRAVLVAGAATLLAGAVGGVVFATLTGHGARSSRSAATEQHPMQRRHPSTVRNDHRASLQHQVPADGSGRKEKTAAWTTPRSIDTASLRSVSCSSETFCVALDEQGEALVFDGSSWAQHHMVDPNDSMPTDEMVSCPATGFCMVVDSGGDATEYQEGRWGTPVNVDQNGLLGLSCPTETFCVAVDDTGDAVVYDGQGWSTPATVDSSTTVAVSLESVSCPSAAFCMAVDSRGSYLTYAGGTWSQPAPVGAGTPYHPQQQLDSVSCTGPGFCMVVDANGNALIDRNGSWSGPFTTATGAIVSTASVDCVSTGSCAVVDDGAGIARFLGSGWAAPKTVDPDPSQIGGTSITALSCTSTAFCLAVDSQGRVLESHTPFT